MYVIELACSVRIGNILVEFFFFFFFGSLWTSPSARAINFQKNLQTAKRISLSKRALQGRKKGTNDFHNVIFAEVFAKIIGKKARIRF